jgi:Protein of unknown function (DUF6044)
MHNMQNNIKRIFLIALPIAIAIFLLLKFKAIAAFTASKFDSLIRPKMAGPLAIFILTAMLLLLIARLLKKTGKIKWPLLPHWIVDEKKETDKFSISQGKLFVIALIIIFFFFAPYIIKGPNTLTKVFDVLDAWVPQTKILAESGKAFSMDPTNTIPNLANGLRLSGFSSGYNVIVWLFMIFSPFTAYTLNLLIMTFTAFWGMALLLKHFILETEAYSPVIVGASLCFALLTFYPPAGLSIAGMPLLLYFFLKIKSGKGKYTDFIFIALFPFYSLLHHAGLFIMIVLGVIFLKDIFRKHFNTKYFIALMMLGILFLFTHFHLLYTMIDPGFVSYRQEIVIQSVSFDQCFDGMVHNFTKDRTNIVSGQQTFILLSAALALLSTFFTGWNSKVRKLNVFILLALINASLWGFKYWGVFAPIRETFPIINAFNPARFYWLNPVVWAIAFAIALMLLSKIKFGNVIVSLLLIGQLGFLFTAYNPEYRKMLGLKNNFYTSLTFKQFYSQSLFDKIAASIAKPKKDYRVVSIGIPPAIAQFNGFYALDIYANIYSLQYKHQFRQIIENEIEKESALKTTFDENGKRCYILTAELHNNKYRGLTFGRGISKNQQHLKIKNLNLNTTALKNMGGEYIFSAVEILNPQENQLILQDVFQSKESPWRIYLYKTI